MALMAGLPLDTWVRLVAWLAIGLAIYFAYGRRRSRAERGARGTVVPAATVSIATGGRAAGS